MIFSDERMGYVDTIEDRMYVMDDYGTLIWVPFCIPYFFFQEH